MRSTNRFEDFADRCVGTMLGLACGDALGAAAEFKTRDQVLAKFGVLVDFQSFGRKNWPAGSYTDDAEMALGLAESLIEQRAVDPVHIGRIHARLCLTEPCRGYGPNTRKKLKLISVGFDPRLTGDLADSNGGLTRIPPLALFLAATNQGEKGQMDEAIGRAIMCTHASEDVLSSAGILATFIMFLACGGEPHSARMIAHRQSEQFDNKLSQNLSWLYDNLDADERIAMDRLIEDAGQPLGRHFAIRAIDCLSIALWVFHRNEDNPELAVVQAVNLGGDADSVGCVVGALCGAAYGTDWIPGRWTSKLEDAERFRDAGIKLAAMRECGSIQEE